jgi:transcriptional regulator with XRE-family HTH domain
MTQGEIATRIGQPISFVSKVEAGTRQLQVLELLDILEVIGVPAGEFLEEFRLSR